MVCSMSHVVWHAEGMESVAGTDGNVVKKPGCMQMIFWDYYGLQVDTNKKPLNNTWAVCRSCWWIVLAIHLILWLTWESTILEYILRFKCHTKEGHSKWVHSTYFIYSISIYIATLIWGYMYMYIEILNCQYHPTQCKTQFHMREQSTSKWNFIMYMWASTR